MLKKIISGGQNGADFGGIRAGKALGLDTGGTAPKGWRVCRFDGSDGSNPVLAQYRLVQHSSREYPPRTRQNVADSDGTLWVGYSGSPGGKLTQGTCRNMGKPYIENPTPAELKVWVEANQIAVLNVAGNRASAQNPDIEQTTYRLLIDAFWELMI